MIQHSNTKLELIQMIKNFMYDSKFKDLGIFSKQYLSSILYSMYEHKPDSLFSLAFGDFDGLRAVNDKYSIPVGDQSMFDSLAIIKHVLPNDTLIARAAGDEFVFLSDSLNMRDWEKQIKKVISTLNENKDKIHGLNITMSAMDSNIYPDFKKLYDLAELDVGRKKHNSQQSQLLPKEDIFKDKVLSDFRKYFNYYRLNEGTSKSIPLPDSYFKIMSSSLVDIVINRFENTDTPLDLYMERLESTLQSNETFLEYLHIPSETALAINNILLNVGSHYDFNSLTEQELDTVFKFLTRDPLTGEFSKSYFKNYLSKEITNEPEKKVSVQIFDLVHLKLSNDTITHVKTDQKISELFGHIVYGLRSKIDYSDFEHDSGNYLVSYGGKLISIQSGDFSISDDEISSILDKARANQRILDIVTAKKSGSNFDLENIINDLSENCVEQKHDLKVNKISNTETIIPLKIALNDSISYFIDNFPEPYSLPGKQHLVKSLWDGMCTVVSERYPNMPSSSLRIIKEISGDTRSIDSSNNIEKSNDIEER